MKSKIRFIFAKNKKRWSFGAWFLMQTEEIDYSHCAIEIDGYVYESVWPKAQVVPLEKWLQHYEVMHEKSLLIEGDFMWLIRQDMRANFIGKRYSIFQLVIIGIGFLSEDLDSWSKSVSWNGSRYLICTELVAKIANKYFGVDFGEELDTISLRESLSRIKEIKEII